MVKVEKCDWPETRCEFLGITLDSQLQLATVSQKRADKLRLNIESFLLDVALSNGGAISRRSVASITGRLHLVEPSIKRGQLLLTQLYKARDSFVNASDANSTLTAWKDSTLVHFGKDALSAIQELSDVLDEPEGRRVSLSGLRMKLGVLALGRNYGFRRRDRRIRLH